MTKPPRLRCAIYTRKSTEEGLDQEFNSLDAQRESCEAYIASQASLGWSVLPVRYDDGGFSGGTTERPALKALLNDIANKRVEVVVVYKIDRLTRSLMDFAKIVDVFDTHGTSFVSVTQAFNTTNSMGRLTLNVLLSFAQFEREVTAERIRDKIAASKRKGMWMGGHVPLGYRVENRKILIDQNEAKTVRFLFDRYLDVGSIRQLAEQARELPLAHRRGTMRNGENYTTKPFARGNLHHLLSNPIYIGKIRHRDKIYDGEHAPIISEDVFHQVQQRLANQAPECRGPSKRSDGHLLAGILFDETGDRLTPTHAHKNGTRYRYYVSRRLTDKRKQCISGQEGWRIPALELEAVVEGEFLRILADERQLHDWTFDLLADATVDSFIQRVREARKVWPIQSSSDRRLVLKTVIRRITISSKGLGFEIDRVALVSWLLGTTVDVPEDSLNSRVVAVELPAAIRRRGVEQKLVLRNGNSHRRAPDPALVDLIVRAHAYLHLLTSEEDCSLSRVAERLGTNLSEISRILPLAFLAPKITKAILNGTQPVELNAHRLSRLPDLPVTWEKQAELLNL